MSEQQTPVIIVGGGFSGTMVAAQLARRGVASTIVEGFGRTGVGTAYSTEDPAHLLNVPAEAMSAWPDDPQHFARFVGEQGGAPSDFAQRRVFGRYLRGILADAVESGCVRLLKGRAVGARRAGGEWLVELADGSRLLARALVLAIGNQAPEAMPFGGEDSPRLIANPWSAEARVAIEKAAASDADVLIVGTGLTMVDTVLSLDSAGHHGRIFAVSRRGLIPRSHGAYAAAPVAQDDVPTGKLTELWRWLRERAGQVGWRAAVDALRPHSHHLWQSLGCEEQRRFLRHARPWWDVHRHRIAPQVAERIAALISAGRLQVIAGRIRGIAASGDSVEVRLARRGSGDETVLRVSLVVNCTGPLRTISRTGDPLLRALLDRDLARPDALGIGLEVDEQSRVAGGANLRALGPLTKGRYWEIVAVPDIRGQAAEVAEDIAGELRR